ncbi:MAG: hypothetical protein CSA33_08180 [Desulfobulbus propionicus]|nr:MAG: hypothetical protein CSA33_08180 [Desulfobulbus propionicus]
MASRVQRITALAWLVILDGLRRHALIGLILFALAGMTGGLVFFDFIPRDVGRASNDFLFSIIWVSGFIFLLFHGVQVVAWDNERGVLHMYLARPISRTEYTLGVFSGLAALLLALNLCLGGIGWGILVVIKQSVLPLYFSSLSWQFYLLAGAGLYAIQLMILAVIVLFSSLVRGSVATLLLSLCYYFICTGLPVVREAVTQRAIAGSSRSLEMLLQGLTFLFPDFSTLDWKTLAATTDPVPTASYLMGPCVLAALYVVLILWLACGIYSQRDLQ